MDPGAESARAVLARVIKIVALTDVVVAAALGALCLAFGWTSRPELVGALLGTAALIICAAGLGGGGARMIPNTTLANAAREALLEAPAHGPFVSTRSFPVSGYLLLIAMPVAVLGLLLYALD